jgi:hypothetical protein
MHILEADHGFIPRLVVAGSVAIIADWPTPNLAITIHIIYSDSIEPGNPGLNENLEIAIRDSIVNMLRKLVTLGLTIGELTIYVAH